MQNPLIPMESGPAWAAIFALLGLSKLSLQTGLTAA